MMIQIRTSPQFVAALDAAAGRFLTTRSEYVAAGGAPSVAR
jgi:hypothetical protein